MLGLYHGQPRARKWRKLLSDSTLLAENDAGLILKARQLMQQGELATTLA